MGFPGDLSFAQILSEVMCENERQMMHHKGFQFYYVTIYTEKEIKLCQWTCFSLQKRQANLLKTSSWIKSLSNNSRFYCGSSYQMKVKSFSFTFKVLKKRALLYLHLTYFSLFPEGRNTANFIENFLLYSKHCLTFTYMFLLITLISKMYKFT